MRTDLAQRTWPTRPVPHDVAAMLIGYGLLAAAVRWVAGPPGAVPALWLANGLATAILVSAPAGRAALLLAAMAAGSVATELAFGNPLPRALVYTAPNLLEVALGATLILRSGGAVMFAGDHRVLLRVLLAAGLAAPAAGAALGALVLQALGIGELRELWLRWVIGSALGTVATLPMVLSWRGDAAVSLRRRVTGGWDVLALAAVPPLTLGALHSMFEPFAAIGLMLVAGAFLLPRWMSFVNVFLAVATLALARGRGWYLPAVAPTPLGQIEVSLAALLAVLPAQVVAVVVARQRAFSTMLSAVGRRAEDILVFADMSGAYRWVNRAHANYWGLPDEQALGQDWTRNLPAALHESALRPMVEQATAGVPAHGLVDIDFPARGRRTLDVVVQPAHDEDGQQIGVLFRGTDVTEIEASRRELQRLSERLSASNENLGQFVRIASHDLREPLNTVEQFCRLIEEDTLSPTSRSYFGHVRGGAARMKALLDDVLRYVHLEAGQPAGPRSGSLDEAVAEALAHLRPRIEDRAAQVQVVSPLGRVQVPGGQLTLAAQNLLSNALKFVPPGCPPQVVVSASDDGPMRRFTVADNGIGIEASHLGELGRPFRRLHTRRAYDGTGLGLAICKRIAEQHGGRLEIESQPGRGSRFHLVLPAAADQPPPRLR